MKEKKAFSRPLTRKRKQMVERTITLELFDLVSSLFQAYPLIEVALT